MTDQFKRVIKAAAASMKKLNEMDVIVVPEIKEIEVAVQKAPKVKFLMYKVSNGETTMKVDYSRTNAGGIEIDVTDWKTGLWKIFDNAINKTDLMTDYFEQERVVISEDSPYWKAANEQCIKRELKNEKIHARHIASCCY
jgi:hypothetical protein